jgi:glycerophosphoryl diester phosphodiesterase
MSRIVFIAHRGASGRGHSPENTVAAFREAMNNGAACIECDVKTTQDGHIVVIHDTTVDRTTNAHGLVSDLPLADIRKLDAGSWFGGQFTGERIPTLREVLDAARGRAITLVDFGSTVEVDELIREIEAADAVDDVVLQTSEDHLLESARVRNPAIPRVLLAGGQRPVSAHQQIIDLVQRASRVGACTLHLDGAIITSACVREAHWRGIGVWAFPVNTREELLRLAVMRIDGFTSDYPELMSDLSAIDAAPASG